MARDSYACESRSRLMPREPLSPNPVTRLIAEAAGLTEADLIEEERLYQEDLDLQAIQQEHDLSA